MPLKTIKFKTGHRSFDRQTKEQILILHSKHPSHPPILTRNQAIYRVGSIDDAQRIHVESRLQHIPIPDVSTAQASLIYAEVLWSIMSWRHLFERRARQSDPAIPGSLWTDVYLFYTHTPSNSFILQATLLCTAIGERIYAREAAYRDATLRLTDNLARFFDTTLRGLLTTPPLRQSLLFEV